VKEELHELAKMREELQVFSSMKEELKEMSKLKEELRDLKLMKEIQERNSFLEGQIKGIFMAIEKK